MEATEYQLIQIVARVRRASQRAPLTREIARSIARDECPSAPESAFELYVHASMDLGTMLADASVPGAREIAREVIDALDESVERADALAI